MKTRVLPINYDVDIERISREEGCNVVGIEEMSVTYTQPADTNSVPDNIQHLTLVTRCAESVGMKEADRKEGFYFDMTIPDGEHWSLSDSDELKAIVDDFKERLYYQKRKGAEL